MKAEILYPFLLCLIFSGASAKVFFHADFDPPSSLKRRKKTDFGAIFPIIAFLALLLFPCGSWGKVFFHADFESGETYTTAKIKPGQKAVFLDPNDCLAEWPEAGGEGVVEGNFPPRREFFRYQKREGNVLKGVAGIQKEHGAWVNVRTGNFYEWYTKEIYYQEASRGRLSVCRDTVLFGLYSGRFSCDIDSLVEIVKEVPSGSREYHFRYYALFSRRLLAQERIGLFLNKFLYGPFAFQRIYLGKEKGGAPAFSFYQQDNRRILRNEVFSRDRVEILPDTKYCLEYGVVFTDTNKAVVTFLVNGVKQIAQYSEYGNPEAGSGMSERQNPFFHIGKANIPATPGEFFIDEVLFADSPVGTLPEKPEVRLKDRVLFGSGFSDPDARSRQTAVHWEIHPVNSWILPLYNSGEVNKGGNQLAVPYIIRLGDTINTRDILPRPVYHSSGIKPGVSCLARVRYQNSHGNWSEWSDPFSFITPAPVERLIPVTDSLPQITRAFFALEGDNKPIDRIQRGKWYDFYVYFQDPKGPRNFEAGYIDIYLRGDPENFIGTYANRNGAFCSRDNYAVSLSIPDYKGFIKDSEGSGRFTKVYAKQGLYFDDSNGEYEQDFKKGFAKARIRLLSDARAGTWVVKCHGVNNDGKISQMHESTFHVFSYDPNRQSEAWKYFFIGFVFFSFLAICFIIIAVYGQNRILESKIRAELAAVKGDPEVEILESESVYGEKIRKAMEFIGGNFGKPISTKEVAAAVNVVPNYLSTLFSKATNKTVSRYINEVRIGHAKKLLKESDLNITEIAFQVGYNSLDHFSRVFNILENVSPKEYRKISREN